MAGAAAQRELNPVVAETGVEFSVATKADEAELRALLRSTPTPGAVSLRFEREPDYFAGESVAGARDTTIIARQRGRLVCMGRCSRRRVYVGGRIQDAGYLGELRLASGVRNGLAVLRTGYAFFAQLEQAAGPAEFYFTSMANSNKRARSVLESGKLGLPRYQPLSDLATVAWPIKRTVSADRVEARVDTTEAIDFLNTQARDHGLMMPWDEATWAGLGRHGFAEDGFCVVCRSGRIVAAGGVWDQSSWRQTVVTDYEAWMRRLRPVINQVARWSGRPQLPSPGERLRQAAVHPLAIASDADTTVVEELLAKIEARARSVGIEWLVATIAAEDPLRAVLGRRRGSSEYRTRLYVVNLPRMAETTVDLRGQLARPEAGWL